MPPLRGHHQLSAISLGMTEQTYYRWRKQYGGMSRDQLWTLLKKVEASCDRYLIAGGTNVEAEWEQGPAI